MLCQPNPALPIIEHHLVRHRFVHPGPESRQCCESRQNFVLAACLALDNPLQVLSEIPGRPVPLLGDIREGPVQAGLDARVHSVRVGYKGAPVQVLAFQGVVPGQHPVQQRPGRVHVGGRRDLAVDVELLRCHRLSGAVWVRVTEGKGGRAEQPIEQRTGRRGAG